MHDRSDARTELLKLITSLGLAGAVGAAILAAGRRRISRDFVDKIVLITGGSRGLGLAMAEEFRSRGAHLAICARDTRELQRARQLLRQRVQSHAEVLPLTCDVSDESSVARMMDEIMRYFGHIDVLVNNAGVIEMGPIEAQTRADFEEAMNINFWGVVNTTLAVLPQMLERRSGSIVNITSIGARIAVPHLLPYSASKFAAFGFSLGLRAELAEKGINVTTVVPGLMRTGSHLNASFKGNAKREFAWFSLGATVPGISISAEYAARTIVEAAAHGKAEVVVGLPAKIASAVHALSPGLRTEALGLLNRLLPHSSAKDVKRKGRESRSVLSESPVTALGRSAAEHYNQNFELA